MKEFEESKLPEEINQAILDLTWKFMSIGDYNQAIESGKLVKKPGLADDRDFLPSIRNTQMQVKTGLKELRQQMQ